MTDTPLAVREFAQELAFREHLPAYLHVSPDGLLSSWGGELTAYGIAGLEASQPADVQLPALTGLLPPDSSPLLLLNVELTAGRVCDIHIFNKPEGWWVVFVRTKKDVDLQRELAKVRRENQGLNLRLQREKRLLHRLGMLLSQLEVAAMLRLEPGVFRPLGLFPEWTRGLGKALTPIDDRIRVSAEMPFLQDFLEQAEQFWTKNEDRSLESGSWTESAPDGEEFALEATALRLQGDRILMVRSRQADFEARRDLLQKARLQNLDQLGLRKEIQKKEILLHCIVHDLKGPLMGARGAFDLLARENFSPKGHRRRKVGEEATARLERLVQDVLDVFSTDIAELDNFGLRDDSRVDLTATIRRVMESLQHVASLQDVRLELHPGLDWDQPCWVVAEPSRLERILFNLLENGLRHSPSGGRVRISIGAEGQFWKVSVEDEGPGVAPKDAKILFEKFSGGSDRGSAGLGLYFCRMVLERWGGSIGYANRPRGGAHFWFRLPEGGAPGEIGRNDPSR